MTIEEGAVERIAHLARLKLEEEERSAFTEQLAQILEYAEKLNELPTDDVEPMAHILPLKNVMREDEVKPSMEREEVLAPGEKYFRVPRILDEEKRGH